MGKEIIESIRAQRRRIRHAMERRLADPEDDCVLVTSEDDHDDANAFWGPLFQHYFVESHDDSRDDMLFFVKNAVGWGDGRSKSVAASRDNSSDESLADESANDPYFVRRKNGRKALPSPTSARINWEESFYLNLIVNQFEYTLTVAICKQDSSGKLRCLSRVSQRVYGSPSRRQMHMTDKAVETELTYPLIYFTVDNFDDIFGEVFVQQEESLCVELVACTSIITRDVPPSTSSPSLSRSLSATGAAVHSADSSPGGVAHVTHAATPAPSSRPIRSTIFQGQVGFPALRQAYCAKQREGASLLSTRSRMEYLLLRGPGGKGGAQVAMGPTTRDPKQLATPRGKMLAESTSAGQGGVLPSPASSQSSMASDAGGVGGLFSGALSSIKRISQTLWKTEEPESYTALNSFLTYVSIPWHTVIDDVLDKHPAPILERMKMHAQVSQ